MLLISIYFYYFTHCYTMMLLNFHFLKKHTSSVEVNSPTVARLEYQGVSL